MLRPITEPAPAKVNLFLHVTGRRSDGYHFLDSLVVFTEFGDRIECYPDDVLSLDIQGQFANVLHPTPDNLVMRAAVALKHHTGCRQGARIILHKEIPIGSGLGGGSSDAAATLRALTVLWSIKISDSDLQNLGEKLGSDVPVCLFGKPAFIRGIGEQVLPVDLTENIGIILINPLIPVLAKDVYARFHERFDISPPLDSVRQFPEFIQELSERRNALTSPAIELCPVIVDGIEALRKIGTCKLARMSGSGSTCFGLFENFDEAIKASEPLQKALPGWWVQVTKLQKSAVA